jgi:hypothetical protein
MNKSEFVQFFKGYTAAIPTCQLLFIIDLKKNVTFFLQKTEEAFFLISLAVFSYFETVLYFW